MSTENIKIQLDLNSGSLSVEAPHDSLEDIFFQLEKFIPCLTSNHSISTMKDQIAVEREDCNNPETIQTEIGQAKKNNKSRKRSNKTNSVEKNKYINLGLSNDQTKQFKVFFEEKKPANQNEQVLVIMYWLKENCGLEEVNKDEVYSAYKTIAVRVPTRISSVLSNLRMANYILTSGNKYYLHHTGEDLVKLELPRAASK